MDVKGPETSFEIITSGFLLTLTCLYLLLSQCKFEEDFLVYVQSFRKRIVLGTHAIQHYENSKLLTFNEKKLKNIILSLILP